MAPESSLNDVSTVVSVLPITLSEEKPGLQPPYFSIPKCVDPQNSCTTLVVFRSRYPVYIDSSRPSLMIPELSEIVAAALCRDYKVSVTNYQPGIAEPGLFWTPGNYSPERVLKSAELKPELQRARDMQTAWFKLLVDEADDSWGKNRVRRMISSLHRLAAQELNLKREWDIEVEVAENEKPMPCKFCHADIHPDAMICMHCRGIVNMARYKQEYVSSDSKVDVAKA